MDGQGNISLPSDIGATAMTEREICELFGVIAPTVRAGIKALCKSGVLSIYDIKRIIRISDRYSAEVYNLETIAAPRFPYRIVRGGESPQGIIREDYTRAKRENDGIRVGCFGRQAQQPLESMMIYQHINMQTYQHTSMQTCKPITMVIYIAGSIPLFRGKRSNHFRLQRQSKHGALCRLKGQAAAPFPDKSSSRFAASVFIGKTLYPTAPCKRAFENGNDRPAAHHRPKGKNNKVGLYG